MQAPRGNGQLGVQWFVREFECGRIEGRPSRGGRMRSRRRGRMSNGLASATTSTSAITKSLCERY